MYFSFNLMTNVGTESFEDDNGRRLKVDENLIVIGQTNVYAIGDCCNTKVTNRSLVGIEILNNHFNRRYGR